jgi:hypothetical protein
VAGGQRRCCICSGTGSSGWFLVNHPCCKPSSRTSASGADRGRRPTALEDPGKDRREIAEIRMAHLLEVATGFRSGDRMRPGPGKPRPEYDPDSTTLTSRRRAKAAEFCTHAWHPFPWTGMPPVGQLPAFGDARVRDLLKRADACGLKPKSDTELLPVLLELTGSKIPGSQWPTQLKKSQRTEHAREVIQGKAAAADDSLDAERCRRREAAVPVTPKPPSLLGASFRERSVFLLPEDDEGEHGGELRAVHHQLLPEQAPLQGTRDVVRPGRLPSAAGWIRRRLRGSARAPHPARRKSRTEDRQSE